MKIEKLEKRVFLSVSLNVQTGLLNVNASVVGDVVSIAKVSNNITVLEAGVNSQFAATAVKRIDVSLEAGADKVTIASAIVAPVTVLCGAGNDTVIGGGGNDSFTAGSGNDSLVGGSANSTLVAGSGADTLVGNGTGTDYVFELENTPTQYVLSQVHPGNAFLDFSNLPSNEFVVANLLYDYLAAYGNVSIKDAKAGQFVNFSGIYSGPGDCILTGNNAGDLIVGGNGNDTIAGGTGVDTIDLGTGYDVVSGEGGADRIYGSSGDYVIYATDYTSDPANTGTPTPKLPALPAKPPAGAYIDGGSGTASIVGGLGRDTLTGEGSDTIRAGDGGDLVYGGSGTCVLYGGVGNDTIFAGDGPTTIYGGHGNDQLLSGPAGDLIVGGAGNNTIYGSTGNDTLYGGDGPGENPIPANAVYHNILLGATGNALMYAGNGGDMLEGGSGNNTLIGGPGNDTVSGGTGTNYMDGGGGINTVSYAQDSDGVTISPDGSPDSGLPGENDTIMPDFQILIGGSGDDDIFAGNYSSTLIGGSGDDLLVPGTVGNDLLIGNAGNNTLYGGSGNDTLYGGAGPGYAAIPLPDPYQNQLFGLTGNNILVAGAGGDYLDGGADNSTLFGGLGNDTLIAEGGSDLMIGGPGNESMVGGAGNCTMYGGQGSDTLTGGDGNNQLSANSPASTSISSALYSILKSQAVGATSSQSPGDSITGGAGNNTLTGGPGNDTLVGGNGNELINAGTGSSILYGGFGNDTLNGGAGNDTIDGGPGNSTLTGGSGDAIFINADATTATVNGGSGYNIAQQTLPGRDSFNNIQFFYDLIPGQTDPNPAALSAKPAAAVVSNSLVAKPLAVPAALPVPKLVSGVLTVNGTNSTCTIDVYEYIGVLYTSINSVVTASFPLGSVKSVIINTLAGNDTVQCSLPNYQEALTLPTTINAGAGSDTLIGGASAESLKGGTGHDVLISNNPYTTLAAGTGNDLLSDGNVYGSGHDSFIGGKGDDTVDFTKRADNLVLRMNGTPTSGAPGEDDTIGANVTNILLGTGHDLVVGNALVNFISGGSGFDSIYGGTGHDYIEVTGQGNLGNNLIFGSTGGSNFIDLLNGYPNQFSRAPRDHITLGPLDTQIAYQAAPAAALAAIPAASVFSTTTLKLASHN